MKLQCTSKELKAALSVLGCIPGVRGSDIDTMNIKIEADEFAGLYLSRQTSEAYARVNIEAKIEKDGALYASYDSVAGLITSAKSELIEFESVKEDVRVSSIKSKWVKRFKTVRPEKEHETPDKGGRSVKVDRKALRHAINRAGLATHKDREGQQGVIFRNDMDAFCACATDGRRMHVIKVGEALDEPVCPNEGTGTDQGFSLPPEALKAFSAALEGKDGEAELIFTDHCIILETADAIIQSPTISTVPMSFKQFFGQLAPVTSSASVGKEELIAAINEARPYGGGLQGETVQLIWGKNAVTVYTETPNAEVFSQTIDAKAKGSDKWHCNSAYLLDLLRCVDDEHCEIQLRMPLAVLTIVEGDATLALMGVRV